MDVHAVPPPPKKLLEFPAMYEKYCVSAIFGEPSEALKVNEARDQKDLISPI